jgi:hypothetical protein
LSATAQPNTTPGTIPAHLMGAMMQSSNRLNTWLFIGTNAYDEYTFIPWLGKNVYRRTVDFNAVCLQ